MFCRANLFIIGLIFRISSVSPIAEIDADDGKHLNNTFTHILLNIIFLFCRFVIELVCTEDDKS